MQRTAERFHDFSYGHRVYGHESKCSNAHGHNGRVTFVVEGKLDDIGRVLDFGEIGKRLCNWVEEHWDHKFLIFEDDPWCKPLAKLDPTVVWLEVNPTAENLAEYLLKVIGPQQLKGTGAKVIEVRFEETRKCAAVASLKHHKHHNYDSCNI